MLSPTTLRGTTTRFKGNGRQLGYPTANLTTETNLADGVYFGYADLADWEHHPAIIFIGVPTTMGDRERRIEVYLLDIPDRDYYDQPLTATIGYYHRANQTFGSIAALLAVMKDDEQAAREWFAARA